MSTNPENQDTPLGDVYDGLRLRSTQLETKNQPLSLSERVEKIEATLLLVADVYRFQRLSELLAAGKWREADLETIQVILELSGHTELESITPNDVRQLSCNQLRVIDKLWTTYSQERFGFSAQIQMYQSVGGSLNTTIAQDNSVIERFGEQVGWRINGQWQKCDELDYTLNAPKGCHPSRWWNSPFGSKMTNYFFARLIACAI
ncbi:GUN4 domain-containing protein [Nostoc sp.]|uniref:GUN4 domain-containing protein n=1 Tax=Nostoc sp. TaxID=1180 RepID=UPI002FFCB6AC